MSTPDSTALTLSEPHVLGVFSRLPVAMSHGQGCWVWDTAGRRYLDGLGGIAVNTLGHNHPRFVAALQEQLTKLIHTSNYYHVPLQETLAAKLCEISGMNKAFFCNSGLEANEAALKIARKFGVDRGFAEPEILVFEGAFHGRSLATMAATANAKVREGFGASFPGFVRVALNSVSAVEEAIAKHPQLCAIFLETVQGEGGINPARIDFLQALRRLCDKHELLLMLDEVQCGIGRTGKWFAHQWAGIVPDVMPLAKGLGSGVPIGAVVCGPRAADVMRPGNHGSTFGGNPLAMRAGVETLRIMEEDQLLSHAAKVGQELQQALREQLAGVTGVVEIRGQGLMIGVELDRPCGALLGMGLERGVLFSVTADRVVRLVPPLIISSDEARQLAGTLSEIIRQFLSTQTPPQP
ncbi:aspartate aminotransferase family protein [Roseateles sp. BYS180W]|uniref:Acetylornithine aminotransferase n=1 Tax=Roseateles rivi TaxID=3299028 RepID=A0ABW7FYQ4_9BURK